MGFPDLAATARSIRRFDEGRALSVDDLHGIIEAAALAPCAGNLQRLRYSIIAGRQERQRIFRGLRWAAHLSDWNGPAEGERPSAYIVISSPSADQRAFTGIDVGIAAAYITLAARDRGIGCCMLLSFCREDVASVACGDGLMPELVLALGYPAEVVVLEKHSGSLTYFRDSMGDHHVPKLTREELTVKEIL